ncbi:MAG: hypothetical protein HYS44_00390 [Candidatus Niyogibacteria bacterium]|nr:hypothetical protein [Candidatus Niyogibacteria bacterium]
MPPSTLNTKIIWLFVGLVVLAVLVTGYFYFPRQEKGAVGTAKALGEAVPEIQTNPGENVPEINPLDRANPYKYVNPLR